MVSTGISDTNDEYKDVGADGERDAGDSRCGVGGSSDSMLHDSIVIDGEEGGKCLPTILHTSQKNHTNHVTDDVVLAPPDFNKYFPLYSQQFEVYSKWFQQQTGQPAISTPLHYF